MRNLKRSLNWLLIVIFLILGIIGLLLPIVPQLIFFAIAFILLSFEFPEIETWLKNKLGTEHKLFEIYDRVKLFLEKYLKF